MGERLQLVWNHNQETARAMRCNGLASRDLLVYKEALSLPPKQRFRSTGGEETNKNGLLTHGRYRGKKSVQPLHRKGRSCGHAVIFLVKST